MSHFRRRFSIRTIITLSIATITIVFMLATGTMLFNIFTDAVTENAYISTKEIVNQVNLNLGYYFSDILYVANYVKNLARSPDSLASGQLMENIRVILDSRKDMVSLLIFSKQGEILLNSADIAVKNAPVIVDQPWFQRALNAQGNFTFNGPYIQNIYESQYPWVISYSQEIRYETAAGSESAILVIDMNFSTISELCRQTKLGSSGYIFLIDSEGAIVYHPRQQLINSGILTEDLATINDHVFGSYTDLYQSQDRLTIIDTVNHSRWRIVGIAFIDEIIARRKDFASLYILVSIIGAITTLGVARLISNKVSSPIKRLDNLMRKVEAGDFDVVTTVEGSREVAHLSHTFNLMVTRIKELTTDIIHEQEQKRKMEFDALQAKINPHFLYNTLDSVVWLAEQGNTEDVVRMVTALARLFRISISKGRETITVGEELEHAQNYLYIQQMRYKDKFDFSITIPEELRNCPTIKLITQPIVENAIYHGIKYLQEPGHIWISVAEVDTSICITIKDNGVGIHKDILDRILSDEFHREETTGDGHGIGVRNIHERIRLTYGTGYGLTLESELDYGTTVTIRIPKSDPIHPIKGVVSR